jgi:hypothetical protein
VVAALVGVALLREHRQGGGDVGEVFVRVPTAAHAFDIQLEGIVVEAFPVEEAHSHSLVVEKNDFV